MSCIHHLVWNRVRQHQTPASERTQARQKRSGGAPALITILATLAAGAPPARAQVTTLLDLEDSPPQPYTFYSYSFQAQLAQTFLTFEFRQDPAYWRLDDASVLNGSGAQSLTNGGMEGGSYSVGGQQVPNGWTLIGQAGLSAGGRVRSGCGYTGSYCYSDGAVGGVDGLYQSFATTIGQNYTISFWLEGDGGSPASAIVQIGASLDNGGVLVPSPPGPTTITGPTPVLAGNLAGATEFDGGTLKLDSSGPVFSQSFTLDASGGTVDGAGLTSTLSGTLSGPGGIRFTNSGSGGQITLSSVNTYLGSTTVDAATVLVLSGAGSIADSSGLTDNGTFDISNTTAGSSITTLAGNGSVVLGANSLTLTNAADAFGGTIGGTGGVTVSHGTETLTGANSYTGNTSIANGATLALGGNGAISASRDVQDNGIFDISATTAGAMVTTLSGSGTVALGGSRLTLTNASGSFSGVIGGSGGISFAAGTEQLAGVNTYSGVTSIDTGATVALTGSGSIAASAGVTVNGTLDVSAVSSRATLTTLSGAGTVTLGRNTLTLSNAGGTFSGGIGGEGGLVLAGGVENLTGISSYSGGTLVTGGGRVIVANDAALGGAAGGLSLNNGTLEATSTFDTARNLTLSGASQIDADVGSTVNLIGNVTGSGMSACFVKAGAGTLSVSGVATMDDGTCVQQGRLNANGVLNSTVLVSSAGILRGTGVINGPVLVNGTLAPGNSPGTLTTTNTVTMAQGSTYQEDVNGTGSGAGPGQYSRLLIKGAGSQFIASGASLDVNLTHITGVDAYTPYVPALGDTYRIVSAEGGVVGTFTTFSQPDGLASGTRLAIFYDAFGNDSIDLRVVPISYGSYVATLGGNMNARSAAAAFDQILSSAAGGTPTDAANQLGYAISGLKAAQLSSVMVGLDGEVHAALAASASQAGDWLDRSVERQLGSATPDERADGFQPGQGLWLDTAAEHAGRGGDALASGFTINRIQTAIGFDLLRGVARGGIGISHTETNISAAAGHGSIDGNLGFIYGEYSPSPLVVDGLLGYGTNRWDTSRIDPLGTSSQNLQTRPNGHASLASLSVRLPWHLSGFTLEPYARALWQQNTRGSFDEGGALAALTAPRYSATGWRDIIGMSGGSGIRAPLAAPFTYLVNLGLGRDQHALSSPTVRATLVGAPIDIASPDIGATFAQADITGTVRFGAHAYGFVGISDEVRRGTSANVGINLGIRSTF